MNPFSGIFCNHLEYFGIFFDLSDSLDSFGFIWILLISFGFFWNLLDSLILLDPFGFFWNLLDYFVSAGSFCKLFLQLNSLNTLEFFRAAWLAWDCGSSELLSSSVGILGA